MRAFVTGASSLIGHGVADALTSRGDEVVCFQRRPLRSAMSPAVTEVLGDVRDLDAVQRAMAGCDAIIHLAAKVGVVGRWEEYRSINVDGTENVISAARTNGVSRVVYVSSPSVAHGGDPIVGRAADPPVFGRNRAWYPESKAIAEARALESASDQMGVVAVRPHLVWGPGDTQLVGRIVERAAAGRLSLVAGGRALVDTTYITNAVDALVSAADAVSPSAPCSGRAYVISNGEPRPVRDLVEGICQAADVPFSPHNVSLRAGQAVGTMVERLWPVLRSGQEPPLTRFVAEQLGTAHWFDLRPAKVDLGWTPRISIDQGLDLLRQSFDRSR